MDDRTQFLIERMDRLRTELKEDFRGIIKDEVQERKQLHARVQKVEGMANKALGIALVAGSLLSWLVKKFGG